MQILITSWRMFPLEAYSRMSAQRGLFRSHFLPPLSFFGWHNAGLVFRRSGGELRSGCLAFFTKSSQQHNFCKSTHFRTARFAFSSLQGRESPCGLLVPHWGKRWRLLCRVSWTKWSPGPRSMLWGRRVAGKACSLVVTTRWRRQRGKLHFAERPSWHLDRSHWRPGEPLNEMALCGAWDTFSVAFLQLAGLASRRVFPRHPNFRARLFELQKRTLTRDANAVMRHFSLGNTHFIGVSNAP